MKKKHCKLQGSDSKYHGKAANVLFLNSFASIVLRSPDRNDTFIADYLTCGYLETPVNTVISQRRLSFLLKPFHGRKTFTSLKPVHENIYLKL